MHFKLELKNRELTAHLAGAAISERLYKWSREARKLLESMEVSQLILMMF